MKTWPKPWSYFPSQNILWAFLTHSVQMLLLTVLGQGKVQGGGPECGILHLSQLSMEEPRIKQLCAGSFTLN